MSDNTQNIQWFPGHMTKTKRKIAEILPLIDAVAEIVDARIPLSSSNPDILDIIGNKPRIILLNKSDMSDPVVNEQWVKYYKSKNISAISIDCQNGKGIEQFKTEIKKLLSEKLENYRNKGMVGKPLRVMVVGIPNVGKSSFINRICGNSKAKVENRPGVTRGNQWFSIDSELELLDTPGVLWPKFDDITVGEDPPSCSHSAVLLVALLLNPSWHPCLPSFYCFISTFVSPFFLSKPSFFIPCPPKICHSPTPSR